MNKTVTMERRASLEWAIEAAVTCGYTSDADVLRGLLADILAAQQPDCWCETCRPITLTDMRMVLCPTCGNKRCPHATDHRNACTGSNEPGQPGSSWENVKPIGKPEPRAEVTDDKTKRLIKTLSDIIHDQTVAMQSAIIEWQHGKGAEAGLSWIVNTLEGPGHLPDFDAPHGKHAQFWFNANQANPLPTCFCGNPSSSLWMGQGFCCDEHYREAKAKHDAARAGEGQ